MIRIIFAILALVFVQLVNGQDACLTAQTNLGLDAACSTGFSNLDADVICMGDCRTLLDAIINNCDQTTADGITTVLNAVCNNSTGSACLTATTNLGLDTTCTAGIANTDADVICMGDCRTLLDAVIDNCDAATSTAITTALNAACTGGTGDTCEEAISNLAENTECITAVNGGTDIDTFCSETCRNLLAPIVSSCDASSQAAMDASTLLSYCGTGTTSACLVAGSAISSTCEEYLEDANPVVCSGTCNTQVSEAAAACEDSTQTEIQIMVSAYETTCNSNEACTATLVALNNNDRCIDALNDGDTDIFCATPCSDLVNAVLTTCPENAFTANRRSEFNQACNLSTGSGSVIIASGIITLLLVAMCALLF